LLSSFCILNCAYSSEFDCDFTVGETIQYSICLMSSFKKKNDENISLNQFPCTINQQGLKFNIAFNLFCNLFFICANNIFSIVSIIVLFNQIPFNIYTNYYHFSVKSVLGWLGKHQLVTCFGKPTPKTKPKWIFEISVCWYNENGYLHI
jgi:hypothetical protein